LFGNKKNQENRNKKPIPFEYVFAVLVIISFYGFFNQFERNIDYQPRAIRAVQNIIVGSRARVLKKEDAFDLFRKKANIELLDSYDVYESYLKNSDDKIFVVDRQDGRYQVNFVKNKRYVEEYSVEQNAINGAYYKADLHEKRFFEISEYKNGKKEGKTSFYDENNGVISSVFYKDGAVFEGVLPIFDEKHKLIKKVEYENGFKSGAETFFDANGKVVRKDVYEKGITSGVSTFFENDKKSLEKHTYNNVVRLVRSFSPSGKLLWSERYSKEGRLDGMRIRYNKKGKLDTKVCYQNGLKHGKEVFNQVKTKWYWKGDFLGYGRDGEQKFKDKLYITQQKFSCDYDDDYHKNNKASLEKGVYEKLFEK
jgi:antitoxin component YwqK of YwqJK toxin-antitoxin module